jgi:hypothetical protein
LGDRIVVVPCFRRNYILAVFVFELDLGRLGLGHANGFVAADSFLRLVVAFVSDLLQVRVESSHLFREVLLVPIRELVTWHYRPPGW